MRRILVVEDDDSVLQLLKELLTTRGYLVDAVENGALASKAFEQQDYDLVLTDVDMPVQCGNALVRDLKSAGGRTPVVALTGARDKASPLFDLVLDKPFCPKALLRHVESLLQCSTVSA